MVRPSRLFADTVVAAIVATFGASAGGAQIIRDSVDEPAAYAATSVDSALRAQAAFEDFRKANLHPPALGPVSLCGLLLPRCSGEGWAFRDAPAEPAVIAERREELTAFLARVIMRTPADRVPAEQRIRYLTESGHLDSALAVAKACSATGWTCDALVGFALHSLGRYVEAESAYTHALARMTPKERCGWRNIDLLIDQDLHQQYERLPCGDPRRDEFEDRAWFFARTLYSLDGNDSRTEHYARKTMELMLRDAPDVSAFPEIHIEKMLQFSWARGWAASELSAVPMSPVAAVKQEINRAAGRSRTSYLLVNYMPHPAYRYVPPGFVLANPALSDSTDWKLRRQQRSGNPLNLLKKIAKIEARRPGLPVPIDTDPQVLMLVARYAPPYAKSLTALEHQKAMFKRGDSALVVMAYDARLSEQLAGGRLTAALVVSPSEHPRDYAQIVHDAPDTGVLMTKAPWGPLLMSAEVYALDKHAVARARYGISPPFAVGTRVTLSDLLFYKPFGTLPKSLEDAAPHALSTERVMANEKLGVYWESYGTDPAGEKMKVSLTVLKEPEDGGKNESTPVIVSVQDLSAMGKSMTPRALDVDISTLKKGVYIVQLDIDVAGQYAVRAEHRIEIIGP